MLERPTSEGLFAAIRRRIWLAVLCALLVPAATYGLSKTVDTEYTASATLLFREPPLHRGVPGGSLVIRDAEANRELLTNVELASLSIVAQRTARRVGGGVTGAQVARDVDISNNGSSDVASVRAKASSGELAARLANAFAREFIDFRRAADVRRIQPLLRRTEGQIKLLEGKSALADALTSKERSRRLGILRRRAQNLDALAAVQTGRAEIVEHAAAPASPSSPKTRTNVAVGAALGLLLGLSLAFFVDRLDRRLRSPVDAERAMGLPVIGSIPRSRALSAKGNQVTVLPAPEREAFRSLMANLTHFHAGEELRSVLVTSPGRGLGRTTLAWHLAVAASESGTRVLLLEADLRRPRLQDMLGLAEGHSLVELLTAEDDLSEQVLRVELAGEPPGSMNGADAGPAVDVVPAGTPPTDPSRLLASERMRRLLRVAQERYELVIVDAPPLLAVADAVPLLTEVSGALVVVRLGHTGRGDAVRLAEQLRHLRARTLGLVVNQSESAEGGRFFDAEKPAARGAIPA